MSTVTFRDINRIALPATVAGLAEPILSITDTAIVGRLGAQEVGAVGLGTSIFMLLFWIFASMRAVLASIIAQHLGKGELNKVSSLIPQAILLSAVIGLLCYIATAPFSIQIFQLYKADGRLLDLSVQYYQIRSIGFPFSLAAFTIFGVFKGYQNTFWIMYITFLGSIVNIVLDFVLVWGIPGWIPSLGVSGAAYASLCAQIIMLVTSLGFLWVRFRPDLNIRKLNPETLNLLTMSVQMITRTIALTLTFFVANRFATSYGDEHIAAHTIVLNIWVFSAFFLNGYENAAIVLAGKLSGHRDKAGIFHLAMKLLKIGVLLMIILSLMYLAGYHLIPTFFIKDPTVIQIFKSFFWLMILSQPINAIAFIFDGLFIGLGQVKFLKNTLLVATLAGFLPFVLIFDAVDLNVAGVWMAILVWMCFRALPPCLKFYQTYYRYRAQFSSV